MSVSSIKYLLAFVTASFAFQAQASCPASSEWITFNKANATLDSAQALRQELELQGEACAFELGQLHLQLQLSELDGTAKAEQHLKHAAGYMSYSYQRQPNGLLVLVSALDALAAEQQRQPKLSKGNWQQTRLTIIEIIEQEQTSNIDAERAQQFASLLKEQQLALANLQQGESLSTAAGRS